MFDIGFLEVATVAIVALIVLGPDKLPGTIRTLGLWIGRLRRSFNNIRREIEQEIGADEIRRQLRNEAIMDKFNSTKNQFTNTIQSVKKEADAVKDSLDIGKEFSDLTGDSKTGAGTASSDDDGEFDPIDSLATNDPTVKPVSRKPAAKAGNQARSDDTPAQSSDDSADNAPSARDENSGKTDPS